MSTMPSHVAFEMLLGKWFEAEHWIVQVEGTEIVAIQSSGYGSGPSEVNISKLATYLSRYDVSSATIQSE